MAMQNGFSSSGVLWERAKELLKKDDCERLKIAIKTFSKTRSVEGLCSDLLKIVNSRSKVDILTEVRRCLPKNQRNNFTRHCNELLETEAERERGDLEKKRKIEAKGILERENSAPNFQGSPAKKTRQDREKPLSSRTEKIASQGTNKLASDCSKESANQARKIGAPGGTLSSQGEFEHKFVELVIERKALDQGFGLRIRGGTFHQPSITVAQVAKDSLADRQGLKAGDRIIRVNDKRCGRGGVDIAQVIGIIKGSETLRMRVVSAGRCLQDDCKIQDVAETKGNKPDGKVEEKRLSTVSVYPDEDGWLGCCIRGGTDYACDVHVISVDSCSPAERAGVKAGDVIVEVNGTSTKHLTHVQVVRLVISSGPCVTFSVKPACKQRKRSSRRQQAGVRPTPLRTQHRGQHDVTPPGSPTFKRFHLPGYPHKQRGTVVDSPSHLPFDGVSEGRGGNTEEGRDKNHRESLSNKNHRMPITNKNHMTTRTHKNHRVPLTNTNHRTPITNKKNFMTTLTHKNHRLPLINKNHRTPITNKNHMATCTHKNHRVPLTNMKPQDTNYQQEELHDNPYPQEPQDTNYQQEPHGNMYPQEPQGTPHQHEPQDTNYKQEELHDNPYPQEPQVTPHQQEPQDTNYQQEPHDNPYKQEPQGTPQQQEPRNSPYRREPQGPLTNRNHRKSIVEKLPWRSLMVDSHQMHLVF
ncbi:hypothetical protein OS493_019983 [Desmophyllum pertusum]|uniref:PDZ domain-containing protein n=1 Tax=Desmophyllum pertusum TaxID=174260 RepID=A0A9W9YBD2_9CNID|nr:hypothetical protein OS493_019983 [Desmophyllum pertusum]